METVVCKLERMVSDIHELRKTTREMFHEENRLKSYEGHCVEDYAKLSENGYFLVDAGTLMCAFCYKSVSKENFDKKTLKSNCYDTCPLSGQSLLQKEMTIDQLFKLKDHSIAYASKYFTNTCRGFVQENLVK